MKETQEGCLSRAINTNFVYKICKPGKPWFAGLGKRTLARNYVSLLSRARIAFLRQTKIGEPIWFADFLCLFGRRAVLAGEVIANAPPLQQVYSGVEEHNDYPAKAGRQGYRVQAHGPHQQVGADHPHHDL